MTKKMTPLLEGVRRYIEDNLAPFQTPGHKQGRWVSKDLKDLMGEAPFLMDLSEPHGIDLPGALAQAQDLARASSGAKASFFLWNGTTGGILASFLAACPGKRVLLSRCAHRSVFAALALAGAEPIYLLPQTLPKWEIFLPPSIEEYKDKFKAADALFLTHPSYWGLARNWQELFSLAHSQDKLVIVDQAHGPHFRLCGKLPPDAIAMGADLVVESTHKVSTALTQASMLHLGTERVAPPLVSEALSMVQSTSPSFLLLCSLEAAVAQDAKAGPLWERTVQLAAGARACLQALGWPVLHKEELPRGIVQDPTRLVVHVRGKGQSGIVASQFLKERVGIVPEMADQHNVVLLLTPADDEETIERLVAGFALLAKEGKEAGAIPQPPFPKAVLSPKLAICGTRQLLPLQKAVGEVAGAMVVPYPPGIPLLAPGDAIEKEQVEYLTWIRKQGWQVDGLTCEGEILVYRGG